MSKSGFSGMKVERKNGNDACINRLKSLNIGPALKIYPKTGEPRKTGADVDLLTNVFGLEISKITEIVQYIVHIKAEITPTKEVVFTKKGKEDYVVVDRHEKCCAIFSFIINKYSDFFKTDKNCLVYDGQRILFSTANLLRGFKDSSMLMQFHGSETNHRDLQNLQCIKSEVNLSKNPSFVFSIEALSQRTANSNLDANNRAYQQILELSLYQNCIRNTEKSVCFENGKLFFVKPLDEGYSEDDCVDVGDGKHMLPGIKRMVQFIEGPFGRGHNNPAVVIDATKVAFHKEQTVVEKIFEILQKNSFNGLHDFEREKCNSVIKGLDCHSTYNSRFRHHRIEGIHHLGAFVARFQLNDGKTCTVAQYFENRYNIKLSYPNMNLLICKDRGNQNLYPMELMTITKNQRVTISQQTGIQSQKTTKEGAVLPNVRQRLIMTGKNSADINSKNETLNQLGVQVCSEPMIAKGKQLPPRKIDSSAEQSSLAISGRWRFSGYNRPCEAPTIWAMYAVGTQNSKFSSETFNKFHFCFLGACQAKGINLEPAADLKLVSVNEIENQLGIAAKNNCEFVFVITDDSITHVHQMYKMIERKYQMIVQDMKMSVANSVVLQGKKLTLENVINKTNVKLGGTNYVVADSKLEDVLVIGVGSSTLPPKATLASKGETLNPVVIGYASNGKSSQEFSGDFLLSPAGQDTIALIEDIVIHSLELHKKYHKVLPKKILVYRSGSSEGSHGAIIAYEIPLARNAMERFSNDIKLIYILVSKDSSYRFFKKNVSETPHASASSSSSGSVNSRISANSRSSMSSGREKSVEMNIPPGIVIDTQVTHPACKQFFLNSHATLQGTAKTPIYTVLADDCNASLSILEDISYNLCHNHQIVGLTTSLPTPLYVANEYAKRGRNLFIEKWKGSAVMNIPGAEEEALRELTNEINYKNAGNLIEKRVNA